MFAVASSVNWYAPPAPTIAQLAPQHFHPRQLRACAPNRAITPPDRVRMPIAPTFCLRRVFCTPAMTAPTMPVESMALPVLWRASRGWYVAGCSAMAGAMAAGISSASGELSSSACPCLSLKLAPLRFLASTLGRIGGRAGGRCIIGARHAHVLPSRWSRRGELDKLLVSRIFAAAHASLDLLPAVYIGCPLILL
jgi:hypothetical protein